MMWACNWVCDVGVLSTIIRLTISTAQTWAENDVIGARRQHPYWDGFHFSMVEQNGDASSSTNFFFFFFFFFFIFLLFFLTVYGWHDWNILLSMVRRRQCVSECKVSFTSCLLRCIHLIFEGNIEVSFTVFEMPISCLFHAIELNKYTWYGDQCVGKCNFFPLLMSFFCEKLLWNNGRGKCCHHVDKLFSTKNKYI